ncbi:Bax inhibitor 1-related protein [Corchorus olitorius]|uniref:Bax inhibitor 1-related protein n=1 Tax=Corchorus olitorius TaxID=93759 RepID=A0A1R3KCZ8_9ROSI|nr:Bax inhibitor 1-related protein [Corchorus olitorius]
MWNQGNQKNDVEGGESLLYPTMLEPVEMRWAFIRKVYSIVAIQLLATIAVAATVVTVRPVAYFFVSSWAGLAVYIFLIIMSLICMFLLP